MNLKKIFILVLLLGYIIQGNTKAQVTETNGYVAIECESTTSPLGKWIKVQSGAPNFISSASGGAHLEFTGNGPNGGAADSPLEYTFTINTPGTYALIMRCSKRLEGEPGDKCNDGWVKMAGDFTSPYTGPNTAEPDITGLKRNEKFFGGNAHPSMGWATQLDYLGHIKVKPRYVFKAGQTYKLTVSGRSIRWNMDYFVLYNESQFTLLEAQQLKPGATSPPVNCWTKGFNDGWDLSKPDGYNAVGVVEATRNAIQINTIQQPVNEWASAKTVFNGETGIYNLMLTSLQETDGECSYKVLVNGALAMEYQNPRIHGTLIPDYTAITYGVKNIQIPKDAVIQVDFKSHSNELIPEGTGFAFARGRWRSLSIGACTSTNVDYWISNDPNDIDGDGIPNDEDNCPNKFNTNQADMDNDGIGDECDPDIDGDGILNSVDNCPNVYNPLQEDEDKDGIGDVCKRSHYKYPGTSWKIPGIIDARFFDLGGEGNAYHDSNVGLENTNLVSPRTLAGPEDVEIEPLNIAFIRHDEWLKYTVDSIKSGIYTIKVSSAALTRTANYEISINDSIITSITAGPTGSWTTFQEFIANDININRNYTNAVVKVRFVNVSLPTALLCNFKDLSFNKTSETTPSGISKTEFGKFITISPNPARNVFYVNTSGIIAKQLSIKNTLGAEVLSQTIGLQQNEFVVNNNLKSGIYFVLITDRNNKLYSEKLIIK